MRYIQQLMVCLCVIQVSSTSGHELMLVYMINPPHSNSFFDDSCVFSSSPLMAILVFMFLVKPPCSLIFSSPLLITYFMNPPNSNSFIGSFISTYGPLVMILVFMFLAKVPPLPQFEFFFWLFCILFWSSFNNPWVQGPISAPHPQNFILFCSLLFRDTMLQLYHNKSLCKHPRFHPCSKLFLVFY